MTSAIDSKYFIWLCDRVNPPYNKFNDLLGQLHSKEFVWVVPNDDNRVEDGLDLRNEFMNVIATSDRGSFLLSLKSVSVLEVIIGLADRLTFLDGGSSPEWAWQLIANLDLENYSDPVSDFQMEEIDQILENLIWRQYEPNGVGGLFPLEKPQENQKEVEIWTQMNAYIAEHLRR